MRSWPLWLVTILLAPAATAEGDCGAAMTQEDLPACRAAAIDDAREASGARPWSGPAMLEAYAAMQRDPAGRIGAFTVPPADPADPKHGLRALSAAARTGYDPTAYPDPERGPLDLDAMLQARTDLAAASDDDAVVAFTLLGLHGAGRTEDTGPLADRLLELQDEAGGWRCGLSRPTPDCTGFALQALVAAGTLDGRTATRAAQFVESRHNDDGGYGFDADQPTSNGDSTAWALTALQLAGQEPEIDAWRYLLSLRDEAGAFAWQEGSAANEGTTAAALIALAGGTPGPGFVPLEVHVPARAEPGQTVTLRVLDADRATWAIDGEDHAGTELTWRVGAHDLDGRVEAWVDAHASEAGAPRVHRATFTVHVASGGEDAPAPVLLPLAALGCALAVAGLRTRGRRARPTLRTGPRSSPLGRC